MLGDTHPDTLISRGNLAYAYAYERAGDVARAVPLLEAVLARHEQELGRTHPDTVICRDNLARARAALEGEPPS